MVIETKLIEEFHPNGQLAYTQTIGILSAETAHLHDNRRNHPEGYSWVRIGRQAKYFDNGQLAWELNYNERGDILKRDKPTYRKDGTIVLPPEFGR